MTLVRVNYKGWTDGVDGPTAAQLNHMQNNLTRALDGTNGGGYLPIGPISITDGSGGSFGDVDVHKRLRMAGGGQPRTTFAIGTLPNTTDQTIGIASGGQILRFAPAAGVQQHQMDNTGATVGDWIFFISTAASGNTLSLYKAGASPAYLAADLIVQCAAGVHVCACLYYDSANWRLGEHSPSATPGASA